MDTRMKEIEQFKTYLERQYPGRRTAIDYTSDIRQFSLSCPKPWREVSRQDIDTFVDQQRQAERSGATIKRRVSALKSFFDFLAEEANDLSWPNPVRVKRHAGKQAKKLPRDLSNDQVTRLWEVISHPRDQAWFVLMLRAGLRVGEIVSLTAEGLVSPPQADQPARLRIKGKGQKERLVLLTADAYAVVQAWLEVRPASEHPALFLNERGQPLQANGIQWLLRRYGQQLDLAVTPHQLRHTYARQLTEAGLPLPGLSRLMGHSHLTTTQIYTAGADPQLAQAYQQAMAQLEAQPLPVPPAEPPDSLLLPASPLPPDPPLPDLQAWGADLPPALRQASLDLVQRRLPGWKAQRRPKQIRRVLDELGPFWRWQLSHRPITEPGELELADLRAYQQARLQAGKATSTINHTLDLVMAILRHLDDQGHPVQGAVFRLKRLPPPKPLPRHLSEAEAQRLETFVGQRLTSSDPLMRLENASFFVLAHTGLRASECLDLHPQDLDLAAGRLTVRLGKGLRDRVVYLSPTAQHALTLYLSQTPIRPTTSLWVRPDGRPLTTDWLYRHMLGLGLAADQISLSPHRLRHTLATRLLNAGMEITRIQKLLGHDHLNTTMIYAQVLDKTLEADYRLAMGKIEAAQAPLSTTPELVSNWPQIPLTEPSQSTESEEVAATHSL
jgi:site-specific recombinase XerD